MKTFFNVLGILISIPLSILLTMILLITPVVSASSSVATANTIKDIVKSIDYSMLFTVDESTQPDMEDNAIDPELIQNIMNTSAVQSVLDLYVEDLFASIEAGTNVEPQLTSESFKTIMNKNIDELVPLAKQFFKANIESEVTITDEFTDEEIKEQLILLIDETAEDFIYSLPTASDLDLIPSNNMSEDNLLFLKGIQLLHNGVIMQAFLIVIAILSILILALRFVRFKGFMWLGVVYLLSAIPSMGIAYVLKTMDLQTIGEMSSEQLGFLNPILETISNKIGIASLIILVLSVVFIVVFVLGRRYLKKANF